jgi:hypothetical protein
MFARLAVIDCAAYPRMRWERACMHWKHVCLAAQAGMLVFSLCLGLRRIGSREIRDSTGAHLNQEARSGVIGHLAAPELASAGRRGPEP